MWSYVYVEVLSAQKLKYKAYQRKNTVDGSSTSTSTGKQSAHQPTESTSIKEVLLASKNALLILHKPLN